MKSVTKANILLFAFDLSVVKFPEPLRKAGYKNAFRISPRNAPFNVSTKSLVIGRFGTND